jgi:hypothetical protein
MHSPQQPLRKHKCARKAQRHTRDGRSVRHTCPQTAARLAAPHAYLLAEQAFFIQALRSTQQGTVPWQHESHIKHKRECGGARHAVQTQRWAPGCARCCVSLILGRIDRRGACSQASPAGLWIGAGSEPSTRLGVGRGGRPVLIGLPGGRAAVAAGRRARASGKRSRWPRRRRSAWRTRGSPKTRWTPTAPARAARTSAMLRRWVLRPAITHTALL